MISQFFVLSRRGDTIIIRDYRGDIIKNTPELFYRRVSSGKGDAAPFFVSNHLTFYFLVLLPLLILPPLLLISERS
jgi:AP-4 complex subunit mu-1